MFLSFTRKFSRQQISLAVALFMLIAPALIASEAASAQKKNAKTAAAQKKNAKPTPAKKTQAKATPTPKKNQNSKTKQTSKSKTETASKDKKSNRKNERDSKSNAKSNDRNSKNTAKSKDRKTDSKRANTKQALAEKQRNSEKNSKTRAKKETLAKNASTRTTRSRTTERPTPKPVSTKTKRKTNVEPSEPRSETTIVKTDATTLSEFPQIIVSTNSVPVRSQAKVDAAPVSNVKLGTVLKVTEKNPAWYKVQFVKDGKSNVGWISANAVNDLNAAQKEEIYRQIVERNFRSEMDFASATELYEFLSSASGELKASDSTAELEFKRLLALRAALKHVGDKKDASPYREFLAARDQEIVYNEPGGEWLVASNRFWDLHKKYQTSPVSDAIAWEAANNPLPGECEGYVNCYLFDMRMRFGEYLNLHPAGRHSGEALKHLTDYLSPIVADLNQKATYNGPTDVTDRAEFNNLIAELRTIVSRLNYIEKEKTLQQLRQIAEAYR